ncbi:MAG: hypothetical protein L3K14_07125 [Thermoplasmata archaeon]|nr:hypothetical protein [Thermoplasmata archaeon]
MPSNPFSSAGNLGALTWTGLGRYPLPLDTWAFAILLGVLGLLAASISSSGSSIRPVVAGS